MKPQPRYHRGNRIANRYLVHQALLGGMGEVYLCLDLEENYPYALKTFQQRYLTDTQHLRQAFEQEVATWVALEKHPNIVRCFWMHFLDDQPFMALEWIANEEGKGTDLRSWLRHGPLDLKFALQIAIDLCNGLLHAQTKRPGLVHRDLKPENILIAQGGLAKLTDFGLAQIVQTAGLVLADAGVTSDSAAQEHRQSLIGGHGITGTPAYMAPEQWRNEPLDVRTDIYALGCILYELLTGGLPFPVPLPASMPNRDAIWLRTLQQAHEQALVPPLPSRLPAAINDLVQRCLAKDPGARYHHLAALLSHLSSIYQAAFTQSPPLRPVPGVFTAVDYNNRGVTYKALGKRDAALADYAEAILLDPTDATAYANRGAIYAELRQWDVALADQIQAITLDPTYALPYYNRGLTYAELGQWDTALADFTQAITLDPNYTKAYANRGVVYDSLGQWDAALADFAQALTLNPTDAQAYYNRGRTNYALGQWDTALTDYTQAILLDPTLAQTYYNRGAVYNALGQQDAALADFTQAITLDPTLAQAYNNRGRNYHALGQWAAALADFTQAITLDPIDAQAYNNRGNIYAELRQLDAALADFTQALTLNPTNAEAYSKRGVIYAALNERAAALADYTQALTLDPTDAVAYYNRGVTYAALGQDEAALADYTQAITLDPTYARAYLNKGVILVLMGYLQEALLYLDKAVQLGEQRGTQAAVLVRQQLGVNPEPQVAQDEQALTAFAAADSLAAMRQTVTRFPLLLQPDFIAAIEQAIAQQASPEQRPVLTQRLAWLRQIANTQHPRSTP